MAYTLDDLIDQLKKNTYVPRTDEEIAETAARRYQTFYDQQRLGANQAADISKLAMDRQLDTLDKAYDKQRDSSTQQYQQAYGQADRQSLSRGLQRSTYNSAMLGNIATAGNKAQQDITDNKQTAMSGVSDQKTLLAQQLAAQLLQYDASQAADTLTYIDELESKEADRVLKSNEMENSLASQIYFYANQQAQQDQEQANWLKTFDENVRQFDTPKGGNNSFKPDNKDDQNKNDQDLEDFILKDKLAGIIGAAGDAVKPPAPPPPPPLKKKRNKMNNELS